MPALLRGNTLLKKYLIFGVLLVCTPASQAQNFLKPYVGTVYSLDSNFFKVADEAEAISVTGSTDKDEQVLELYAGLDGEVPISRQTLEYGLRVNNNTYENFSQLDNTGYQANLNLDWRAGQTFSGDFGIKTKKSLTLFTELQSMEKDMRTVQNVFFKGTHRFHPDWYVTGGLGGVDISHNRRSELNRDEARAWVEILFASSANTRVGILSSRARGKYANTQIVDSNSIDNGYKSTNYSAVVYWEGSVKSSITARMGITKRQHDDLDSRDYNGSAWRIEYRWNATAKTRLDLALWRDIRDDLEVLGFVEETGISIEPRFDFTPKLSVRARLKFFDKRFEGDAATELANSEVREDNDMRIHLKTVYKVTPKIRTFLSYDNAERDSTRDIADYSSNIWRIGAEFRF